jgi:hypothetical protein
MRDSYNKNVKKLFNYGFYDDYIRCLKTIVEVFDVVLNKFRSIEYAKE